MKRLISLLLLVVATPLMGDTAKFGDYTWTYRINDDAAEIYNNNWLFVHDCGYSFAA